MASHTFRERLSIEDGKLRFPGALFRQLLDCYPFWEAAR